MRPAPTAKTLPAIFSDMKNCILTLLLCTSTYLFCQGQSDLFFSKLNSGDTLRIDVIYHTCRTTTGDRMLVIRDADSFRGIYFPDFHLPRTLDDVKLEGTIAEQFLLSINEFRTIKFSKEGIDKLFSLESKLLQGQTIFDSGDIIAGDVLNIDFSFKNKIHSSEFKGGSHNFSLTNYLK